MESDRKRTKVQFSIGQEKLFRPRLPSIDTMLEVERAGEIHRLSLSYSPVAVPQTPMSPPTIYTARSETPGPVPNSLPTISISGVIQPSGEPSPFPTISAADLQDLQAVRRAAEINAACRR